MNFLRSRSVVLCARTCRARAVGSGAYVPDGELPTSKPQQPKKKQYRAVPLVSAPTDIMHRQFDLPENEPENSRGLTVAVVGAPNAGKSVLLNILINNAVSAVSPKRNTTRERVLGLCTYKDTQLEFFDTPGFVQQHDRKRFIRELTSTVQATLPSVDVSLLVVDAAKNLLPADMQLYRSLVVTSAQVGTPTVLVLNKVDLVTDKMELLPKAAELLDMIGRAEEEVAKGRPGGVAQLRDILDVKNMAHGGWRELAAPPTGAAVEDEASGEGGAGQRRPRRHAKREARQQAAEDDGLAWPEDTADTWYLGTKAFPAPAGANEKAKAVQLVQTELFLLSGRNNDGVDELRETLRDMAPLRPWNYAEKEVSWRAVRCNAAGSALTMGLHAGLSARSLLGLPLPPPWSPCLQQCPCDSLLIRCPRPPASPNQPTCPNRSQVTDMSVLERVEEQIRQQIYRRFNKEVPYRVTQQNL
jgi:small GTP-binding protein